MQMKTFCLTLAALLAMAESVLGQWSTTPDTNLVVAYGVMYPRMISDGDGGAIIVYWSDLEWRVYVQKLDRFGYPQWGDYGIYLGGDGLWEEYGYICSDDSGAAIIVFFERWGEYPIFYSKLWAQRVNQDGMLLWGSQGVPLCTLDSIHIGAGNIGSDGYGGAFVTWQDYRFYPEVRLYGQHLDSQGNMGWGENGLPISGETNWESGMSMTMTPSGLGQVFITWAESGARWGQRMDRAGNFLWGPNGLPLPSNLFWGYSPGDDGQGGNIATAYRQSSGGYYFIAQRLDSLGSVLWGENGIVISDTSFNCTDRYMARSQTGTYLAWADDHTGIGQCYIQRMTDNGELLWGPLGQAIAPDDSMSGGPVILASSATEIIVPFFDNHGWKTYRCQKFDSGGSPQWSEDVILKHTFDPPAYKNIISDMAGGAIICWTNYPEVLYAQQISTNGGLGEVLAVTEPPTEFTAAQFDLLPISPNPFNGTARITFMLGTPAETRLVLFDVSGREVQQLANAKFTAGKHTIVFNGSTLCSGIYFARLTAQDAQFIQKIALVK